MRAKHVLSASALIYTYTFFALTPQFNLIIQKKLFVTNAQSIIDNILEKQSGSQRDRTKKLLTLLAVT